MIKANKYRLFTTIIFLIATSCSASTPISEIEQFPFKANLSQDWVLTNKTISYIEKPYESMGSESLIFLLASLRNQ